MGEAGKGSSRSASIGWNARWPELTKRPSWYAGDRPKHGGARVAARKTRGREWNGV
jgi:hypothetical protein